MFEKSLDEITRDDPSATEHDKSFDGESDDNDRAEGNGPHQRPARVEHLGKALRNFRTLPPGCPVIGRGRLRWRRFFEYGIAGSIAVFLAGGRGERQTPGGKESRQDQSFGKKSGPARYRCLHDFSQSKKATLEITVKIRRRFFLDVSRPAHDALIIWMPAACGPRPAALWPARRFRIWGSVAGSRRRS